VAFNIDANGILSVTAVEKSSGKENQITVTNDKGRLSKEEIEHMVNDAEKYRAEDEKQKQESESKKTALMEECNRLLRLLAMREETIFAKNALRSYCFTMKHRVVERISDAERTTVIEKCNEALCWLDANQFAEKEEIESQLKKLEAICHTVNENMPILPNISIEDSN
jgi:L1 cell adhesion molecule like protein